jgi:hypothetical protein
MNRRRRALFRPARDAMEDRSEPKKIEGDIEAPVRNAVAPGRVAIGGDIVGLAWDIEREKVRARKPTICGGMRYIIA